MLNDVRESLGKVNRYQCKLAIFQFAPISSTILYLCLQLCFGGLDSLQTLKPPVVSLHTVFSWQSEKCLNLIFSNRSAFIRKLYKWSKFLPQRTPSTRREEVYPHKKNLKVFLLKIGVKREGRLPCSF